MLEDIGFYTLTDERARTASATSPLHRCELLLTDRCNFRCPYCRGLKPHLRGDLPTDEAENVVEEWIGAGLRNVRFSGGEPTLYDHDSLDRMIERCRVSGVHGLALSTNGSAPLSRYLSLIERGVNDLSISLDACCSATGDAMAGRGGAWHHTLDVIRKLSGRVYVTAGIVLTQDNMAEAMKTVMLAHNAGCSDIRIIPAAQDGKRLETMFIAQEVSEAHPILRYRLNNIQIGRGVRGLLPSDNHHCPLVLDDMAVVSGEHYPCIIYLREQGDPIGAFTNMDDVRRARLEWSESHDCYRDTICRQNCLDVCVDYNNRWRDFHDN